MHHKWLCLPIVFILCLQILSIKGSRENIVQRPQLRREPNNTLVIEAGRDHNVTFRLMGEASTVMVNDVDLITLMRQRQRILADRKAAERREPLSVDVVKNRFREVDRKMTRLQNRLTNARNTTRRSALNQRILRRQLQRVERVNGIVLTLTSNLAKDECKSSPCKNGGTCYDAYKAFQCVCAAGWQGPTCEDDVNECFDLAGTDVAGCLNNGQCINTPGSYRCNCRNGFTGAHCRVRRNSCLGSGSLELCGEHGTCIQTVSGPGYVCVCNQGWTWADTNATAATASPCSRDVDECAPRVNPCHDECINLPGSFRCGPCPPGYTGDGRFCRDVDECDGEDNGGCSLQPRVACINTEGSYRCGRCPPGWKGDGRTCTADSSNTCDHEQICHPQAKCEYISGTVVCTCPVGSFGHGYGPDGCTQDSGRKPCDQHPCQNNGTCVENGRGTTCICQPGYTGALCNSSDACHPSPCLNGGSCRLLPGNQYQCYCPAGFTGTLCAHQRFFCGAVLRGPTGMLHFPPGTPDDDYQPNERCPFIIRTNPGQVLNLTFTQFDLQNSTDCSADFLQLHDGRSLTARFLGRYCGFGLPGLNGTVLTSQDQAFFWFRSDNETQGKGFNVVWNSIPFSCGVSLDNLTLGQSGVLKSPGYPGMARPKLDCHFQLTAPFGTRLILRFYEITLGGYDSSNCTHDTVTVYDSDRLLMQACASGQPAPLHSSSNRVVLDFHTDLLGSDSSFQVHYEVVAGQPECGGVFTEPRGRISGHMDSEVCLYLIEQPKETQVRLAFEKVNLLASEDCSLQKIEIFDGRTTESRRMRRICGQREGTELQPLTSTGNVILVRYEYAFSGLKLKKSFILSYSRVCGQTIRAKRQLGILTTPNYPNSYLEDMTCTYNLTAPTGAVLRINITDLSLGTTSYENETNYLDVYLGRDEKRRISKPTDNLQLVSHLNRASLVFHGSTSGRGLRVEYKFVIAGCGGFLSVERVRSLNRFRNFCSWIIDVPGRKKIIASSVTADADIYIYDNSTTPGTLLNRYSNEVEDIFDGDLLTIIMRGNRSVIFAGVNWVFVPPICGGEFNTQFGYIKSPNWPNPYSPFLNCTWIIRAPFGHRLELIVKNFTLESPFNNCQSDWLEIRNGDSAQAPLIGKYCGSSIPPRVPSFGNALYLKFHSDDSMQFPGFFLNWQQTGAGCGGRLNSATGSIHSPHSMAGNRGALACDWQIILAEGSRVALKVESMNERLCDGLLTIYDGPTTTSRALKLDCKAKGVQELQSSGNRVLVRYDVSHESPEGISFVIDYNIVCRVRLENLQGAIESPNFPDPYPPRLHCEWDIQAGGHSNHLSLVFSHLTVERLGASSCDYDYVAVKDMQDEEVLSEQNLCTAEGVPPITSVGNRLLLSFHSDSSDQKQGFRAEYRRLGCGDHFRDSSASFESPKRPFSVDVACDWIITAPEGKQIRLLLHEVYFERSQKDCSDTDVLTVSAPAGFNSSVVLYRTCHEETQTQTFTSPGNEMRIRYVGGPARARKFFRAYYSQVPARCGYHMTASSGLLTSPGFHDVQDSHDVANYTSDVECIWTVEVTDSYGIKLWFEQVNLTDSTNCSASFVELTKLEEDGREQFLERACGEDAPLIRAVHGQKLRVRFKAHAGTWGRFAMHYERQCGGPLTNGGGYLRSQLDDVCDWRLSSPEGGKLYLRINQLECPKCTLPSGNCTDGLQILNDDDEVLLYQLCHEHPASLVVPANNVRILTKGVRLQAEYSGLQNSCGGNITSPRGSVSSPNYPDSYPANVECVWTIDTRPGNALVVIFEALDIVPSDHCNADFLELRTGVQGQLLGLFCKKNMTSLPRLVKSPLWIKFRSQPGNSAGGFRLRWDYAHNNEISNGTSGIIESPPPILVRSEDAPFTWRVFVNRDRVVVLEFEEYISGLSLFDGYDDNALQVEITASSWRFTSSSNVLYLRTENADLNSFRLKWHVLDKNVAFGNVTLTSSECTTEVTLKPNASIMVKSPGYPLQYAPNLRCEWTFRPSDTTRHIYTQHIEANLEASADCSADFLNIQSSSDMVHWTDELRTCRTPSGNQTYRQIHGNPNLRLQFITDSSIGGKGFRATVHSSCGSNMTGLVGTISETSLYLAMDDQCEWHIEVRPGRSIEITINYNGPPVNATCQKYGLIYDGLDAQAPLLANGKFCNAPGFRTTKFRTSGSHAYVIYDLGSIAINRFTGLWNLTYREFSECDEEIQLTQMAPSYEIRTPGFPYLPHPHADCTWLVVAPAGETIAADFGDPFELSVRHCDAEFVELFDGSTTLARRIARKCRKPQSTLRSTGNLLLIHYQSQLDEPHGGFRLNLSVSTCGGQFSEPSGSLTSENYPTPGGYPKPAECVYSIRLPKDKYIKLTVIDLNLPKNATLGSSSDRLEIVDLMNEGTVLAVLTESEVVPVPLVFNTNAVAIRFITITNVNSFRGFRINYSIATATCSQDVNGVSGNLEISNLPETKWLRFCRWKITVPKGQRVRLEVLDLANIPIRNFTTRLFRLSTIPHMSFFNDANSLSLITKLQVDDYNGSAVVESTENFMFVSILTNYLDLSSAKLRARYSSSKVSLCPPNIGDQASGSLSNLNLIQLPTYYCSINFVGSAGTTITFKVHEYLFQTRGGPAVIFKDDELRTWSKALIQNVTNSFVSMPTTRGKLTLFHSDRVKLQRFRASFRRHNCGGKLRASEGLTIELPELFSMGNPVFEEVECLWIITSSRGYVLDGNFTLTDSCDREFLVILSGSTEVARFCRGMSMNSTLLNHPVTDILYHSQRLLSGRSSFTIRVQRPLTSGNVIQVSFRPTPPVTINSVDYLNNMERIWEFSTSQRLSLRLTFEGRFFIETSPNCSNDRLTVEQYDVSKGYYEEIVALCGRQVPETILVQSSKMRVIFRTNGNITGDGFSFVVSTTCDFTLKATNALQTRISPSWVAARGQRLNCTYLFVTETEHQLLVRVTTRNRSWAQVCGKSYFKLYRRDEQEAEDNGERLCPQFEVSGYRRLRLQYVSTTMRQFEIQYQLIGCGGNHSEPFTLQPPQHEEVRGTYAHDKSCQWRVTAPPQHAIVLEFKYFDLESSSSCGYDSLAVYRGSVPSKEQTVRRLCGNFTSSPPTIMVDSNEALIEFKSDSSNSLRGFQANVRFTPNCNEPVSLDADVPRMNLMRTYRTNASDPMLCHFRATAPPDYRLSVEMRKLQLNDNACAMCNYVQIMDSAAIDSQSLGKYYGLGANRIKLFSSYEDMTIQLSTGAPKAQNISFELVLQMERSVCGQTEYELQANESITLGIQYDNSTKSYEGSVECKWSIRAEGDVEVDFQWLRLNDVSQQTGKCVDYLKMSKPYSDQYFCGVFNKTYSLIEELSESEALEFNFHISELQESSGFEIILRQKPICNRNYTQLSQAVVTNQLRMNCTEYIRVPEGYSITIYISSIIFDDSPSHFFNVTDVRTNQTVFGTTDFQWVTVGRFTTTNELRLDSHGLSTVQFSYYSTKNDFPSGCGGDIAVGGSRGIRIGNPLYSGRNSSTCTWHLTAPPGGSLRMSFTGNSRFAYLHSGENITIPFKEFNMGSESNCQTDSVKFYQTDDIEMRLIKRVCGSTIPDDFTIAHTAVTIVAKKSPNFDGIGFQLDITQTRRD
ncbi:hypothetical protein KR018_002895 [Drosophila ironensis]|nr:hypothetical protein KR018_002895 [Drosophila ironensis]